MSEPIVFPSNSGQELQVSDVDNLGAVSGLADDRLLAELLRLAPYTGSLVSKCVIPYSQNQASGYGLQADEAATVQVSVPNGSVAVLPHRAVIGTRNANSAAPSPNPAANYQSNELANWRDIRSAVFVGSASSPTALVALAPNSSGNPRWDLIYTTVAVDANGPSVTRRIKNPSTGTISAVAVPQYLQSTASVAVVTGTPGATPSLPSLPADAGGNYNVPLAYVRVPNGFSSTSQVQATDIRAFASTGANTASSFKHLHTGIDVQPATGNNDVDATYATNFPWNASAGGRPGCFLPPDWGGGRQVLVELDCFTPGSYSHTSGTVVDSSINWAGRMVKVIFQVGTGKFANDRTAASAPCPQALNASNTFTQLSSTFYLDGNLVASTYTVMSIAGTGGSGAISSLLTPGSQIGLYVDTTGILRAFVSATSPNVRVFAWLIASGKFPNY